MISPVATSIITPPLFLSDRPTGCVGRTQRRDERRAAVYHAEAVEMAAVFRSQRCDERRQPAWHEAVRPAPRAQTGETSVDEPQFWLIADGFAPRHLVNLHITGTNGRTRQKACVVIRQPGSSVEPPPGRCDTPRFQRSCRSPADRQAPPCPSAC